MTQAPAPADVARAMFDLLAKRRPGRSICPSEVARSLSPGDWRSLMALVRRVAQEQADAGLLEITQKGRPVSARTAKGPFRLALPARFDGSAPTAETPDA
jgi:hypothetical protein